MRLKGKNIIVTGASRGIGAALAQEIARQGARVAITYSSQEAKAQEVLDSLTGSDHMMVMMKLDDASSISAAFAKILDSFGTLDGLVNNAGMTKDQLALRMSEQDFSDVLNVNLLGTFLTTKEVLKPMMKKRSGSVVNITSVVGQTGNAGQANYSASKAGVEAMTKSMAYEFASRDLRFNCVAPGFIETDMTGVLTDAQKTSILSKIPLNRMGTVHDVAHAVVYLLSDESSYLTGQTLGVNGGMHMN